MKTIEEAASEYATKANEQGLANGYIAESNFDFRQGIEFAQRWIPIEEELPTNREVVLVNVPLINYPLLFCYNQITQKWFQLDDGDWYESNVVPISWRPIERK